MTIIEKLQSVLEKALSQKVNVKLIASLLVPALSKNYTAEEVDILVDKLAKVLEEVSEDAQELDETKDAVQDFLSYLNEAGKDSGTAAENSEETS